MSDAVERARQLVSTQFRPQGRDPRFGLDCVGLVIAAHDVSPNIGRADDRLRGDHWHELLEILLSLFGPVATEDLQPGDVLLLKVRADQPHLAIATDRGFIHADCRAGRVVECGGQPPWPVAGVLRRLHSDGRM